MRLTRTEINLAYHYADWEYWNSSNTVTGIMVSLSNNHTLNGKPFVDICDRFDKQRFPKWFKFTGWHPQCRCIATPISPNRKELIEYLKKVRDGEDVSNFHFTGEVTELPASFTDWMSENAERLQFMQAKGRLPYFIKENFAESTDFSKYSKNGLIKGIFKAKNKEILQQWDDDSEREATPLTKAQLENAKDVSAVLGIEKGERMNFNDADNMNNNPRYNTIFDQKFLGNSCSENCTLCVVSHELRMRGWDVEAKGLNYKNELHVMLQKEPEKAWIDPNTLEHPIFDKFKGETKERTIDLLKRKTREIGRYNIKVYWKHGDGHIFCVDRLPNNELRFFDPQNGVINNFDWLKDINLHKDVGILKIDKLLIDAKIIKSIIKAKKSNL